MNTNKKAGIWLDHATANIFDPNEEGPHQAVSSRFTVQAKEEAMSKNENLMHNKEQHLQEAYYKKIGAEILKYDHVLLFGPTSAKTELHNLLNKDLHFKDIKIDVESADKMTEPEKRAFVRSHFKKQL